MRLLLVDDDDALRALLRTTFEVVDIDVEEAASAVSALEAIRDRRPDAIVLDVRMPGMSGLELCRRLKTDPATEGIAIVLLTGSDGGGSSAEAEEMGADALMGKPFSPLELLAVVERLTGGLHPIPFRASKARGAEEQLLLYARDLRYLLEMSTAEVAAALGIGEGTVKSSLARARAHLTGALAVHDTEVTNDVEGR